MQTAVLALFDPKLLDLKVPNMRTYEDPSFMNGFFNTTYGCPRHSIQHAQGRMSPGNTLLKVRVESTTLPSHLMCRTPTCSPGFMTKSICHLPGRTILACVPMCGCPCALPTLVNLLWLCMQTHVIRGGIMTFILMRRSFKLNIVLEFRRPPMARCANGTSRRKLVSSSSAKSRLGAD